jgi:hypothetical protein
MGPAGIEVHYRRALAEQLSEQTGATASAVANALDELDAARWIQREENLVWVPGQLEFDPNMKPSDAKHRKSIQRHLAGLPHLPIIARFVAKYVPLGWFPVERIGETTPEGKPVVDRHEERSLDALRWALEGPPKGLRSTEDRIPMTDDREPNTDNRTPIGSVPPPVPRSRGECSEVFLKAWQEYPSRGGHGNSRAEAWRCWRARTKAGRTEAELYGATVRYRDYCYAEGLTGQRYVMQASKFYGPGDWIDQPWKPTPPENGKARPGSEAATVREERPRSTAPRQGADEIPGERQRREDKGRVVAWVGEHRQEAMALEARLRAELAKKPGWEDAPAKIVDATIDGLFEAAVLALLTPQAVA